jgi:hypothetical protein
MDDTLYREAGGRARNVGLRIAPDKFFQLLPEISEIVAYMDTGAAEGTMNRVPITTKSLIRD